MSDRSKVIAIIQPFVPNYRVGLFDAIDARLKPHGLHLEVWHAQPKGRVAARGNSTSGPWSVPITQHRLSIGRRNITFRNVHRHAREVGAVVAGLASTNVETYGLAADPQVRLMLWGHGRNYTAANHRIDAAVETWLRRRATHVFAYTESGKEHLISQGARESDITVVQNSTDTNRLREYVRNLSPHAETAVRTEYDLEGARVGLFVGAFDEPKKLPMLFEAADIVRSRHPEFALILAGAGPDEAQVREMARSRDYVRLVGRADGPQLARLSTVAEFVTIPGRVGLVAVDALALGLPIVTTDYPMHAPEADYLTRDVDSVWTGFSAEEYADGLNGLLEDEERLRTLSRSAALTGESFSIENSAERFVTGIRTGLNG